MALTEPTTISYRYLTPSLEAPVNRFFSRGKNSAAIRIPKYANEPETFRFEFRPPEAICNAYLAMAAMLLAGIDGIGNKIDPSKQNFGPIDEDIFNWPPEKSRTIKGLPTCLGEALQIDHAFLLQGEVFISDLFQDWISKKWDEEKQVLLRPHPYETELYYNIFSPVDQAFPRQSEQGQSSRR